MQFNDRELQQWQYNYKDVVNHPRNRELLCGRTLGFVTISKTNRRPFRIEWQGPQFKERGTIEFSFGDGLGHFLSYYKEGLETVIFDPSYGTEDLGGFLLEDWMEDALKSLFPRRRMYRQNFPLQVFDQRLNDGAGDSDDTWCQSWSLGMIHPSLQGTVQLFTNTLGDGLSLTRMMQIRRAQAKSVVAYFADRLELEHFRHVSENEGQARYKYNFHKLVFRNPAFATDIWARFYTDVARTPVVAEATAQSPRQRPRPRNLLGSFSAD